MRKLGKILGFGGLGVAFGPLAIALLSFPLSSLFGCTDGGANPGVCAIGGSSMGEFLFMMAMLHWVTLLTFLPGIGIAFIGLVLYLIARFRKPSV